MEETPGGGFDAEHKARLVLSPETSSVAEGRAFVRDTLMQWGLYSLADRAVLVASELITNAVLHTRSSPFINLFLVSNCVRLEIADSSERRPRRRNSGVDATTGRGILLVESISDRWGASPIENGKVVWCEFDLKS